jgi:flagellar M-ring protein FliF
MKALLDGLKALGPMRLAAMAAVALGMLGLLALMVLRGGNERMALLYGDLDMRDSAQMVEHLEHSHIAYRIAGQGRQILVPAEQVANARLLLAKDGLPSGGSIGYEIFDRGDGLAATEFQQKINETRALEGELSRTIRAMNGVRAVRVHLVLPRREPFAREAQEAQASVMLTMSGAARLDQTGVQAVVNLIAAAVPGLRPQHISVVDSRGDLLARAGEPVGVAATAISTEEIRRGTELRLARAVEEMLEPSLGPGHVRAEAAVRMSFDRVNETQERYDPDGQVTRSTQNVTDTNKTTEANSAVSVQNNLPNVDAAAGAGAGTQQARQEETTNYEIGRTVRTLIREQPQIDRISLAVMIDGVTGAGADGKPVWQPRSADELVRIGSLVRSAIGFDEKRGDHVDVVSMRFAQEDTGAVADRPGILGIPIEKADLLHLAETALFGLIGLLALLLVLRPMVLRLTTLQPLLSAPGADAGVGTGVPFMALPGVSGDGAATLYALALPGQAALPATALQMLEDESMVHLAQIDGQMRASSLRKIADLADKHPEETLSIVRGWMAREAG